MKILMNKALRRKKQITDEQSEERAKQLHEHIYNEFYKPAVDILEREYKDHIEENKRLKEENKILQAKLDGYELAKQLFIDGYKAGKEGTDGR